MADWYSKGHSQYTIGDFHMAFYMDMNGYPEANYATQDMEGEGESGDPFMAFSIDTQTWTYGQGQVEIGLLGSHRIRINSSGIYGWDGDSWENLIGGGGATVLNDLTDVVIDGTPAEDEVLAWDTSSSKWINQTAAEAGLATSGHTHAQLHDQNHDNTDHTTNYHTESDGTGAVTVHSGITDAGSGIIISTAERDDLHTIYSLEQHDNTYHSTNYEPTISPKNTAFNKDFGTLGTEVCVGNDSRLSDARTPTAHVLATSGPHTDSLPLADLADYTAGRIIYGGVSDWQFLALGTESYVLKAGATYPAWGTVDWSELTGSQPAPISHALDTHSVPTGSIAMSSQKFTGLAAGTTNGDSVRFEQLHAESHSLASHSSEAHNELTGYNDETDVKHLTDAQLGALHTIYSLEVHDNDEHDPDYASEAILFEKGSTFPVSPTEGLIHWDTDDEAWYRYSSDAQAWIQIGASGVASSASGFAIHGVATDTEIHSNDAEQTMTTQAWEKKKEIIVHRTMAMRVYHELRVTGTIPMEVKTRLYVNGIPVGTERSNTTTSWVGYSDDIQVYSGDLVQIYMSCASATSDTAAVRYMRIRGVDYVNNDP